MDAFKNLSDLDWKQYEMTEQNRPMHDSEHLQSDCQESFYPELYHEPGASQSVVFEPETHRLYLEKHLKFGDPAVFEYLRTHRQEHIPRVFQWWESDNEQETLVVIEEWIHGRTLTEVLAEEPDCPDSMKKGWILQLCDALHFLHHTDPKIIHRDIKADNIMMTEDHVLKLVDYDAAKFYHDGETRDTVLLGTDGSAAPEQYGFSQSDERTDIFAVGRLIQDLFPGHPGMQRIAERACKMDPKDRFQDAGQLKKAVKRVPVSDGRKDKKQPASSELSRDQEETDSNGAQIKELLSRIPGFRHHKAWHMILAIIGYALMAVVALTMDVEEARSPAELWANRIVFLLCGLIAVDAVFARGPVSGRLPGVHYSGVPVRILIRAGWGALGIFIAVAILVLRFPAQ